MHDPDLFKDPEHFNPKRFIDWNGKFVQDERVIYFGTGKRRCVEEILARAEQYLFCAALLQRYQFLPPVQDQLPLQDYLPGLNMHPKPFSVRIINRLSS